VNGSPTEPLAIIHGDVEGLEDVPVRVHDACFTSEVLGSMKCDCAEQLNLALKYIQEDGPGVVVYLQQVSIRSQYVPFEMFLWCLYV
jgi:GTP cyclohydrolase II